MGIEKREYASEGELHSWVEDNIRLFFGDVLYLPGFRVSTRRGKSGIPDGFVLDIKNSTWTIIETELLSHGVWDHISEQIIRYIVASRSESTKRYVRNRFFDLVDKSGKIEALAKELSVPPHRLMEHIENILQGNTPDIAIFIDKINEDLEDMVEALSATIRVYTVQKYLVDGKVQYLPEKDGQSVVETTVEDVTDSRANVASAIAALGGAILAGRVAGFSIFQLADGGKIVFKYSKLYERESACWYGITPGALEKYKENGVDYIGFVLGNAGVAKLDMGILAEYLQEANVSRYPDGTIRHYHVLIRVPPELELYISKSRKTWSLESQFMPF